MKGILTFLVILVLVVFGYFLWNRYKGIYYANKPAPENIVSIIEQIKGTPTPGQNQTALPLNLPDGFALSIYAKDLGNPRDLELDPKGTLVASLTSQGRVVAIPNGTTETIASGLTRPHGIAFTDDKL